MKSLLLERAVLNTKPQQQELKILSKPNMKKTSVLTLMSKPNMKKTSLLSKPNMKKTSLLTLLKGNILKTLLKLSHPWIVIIQQLLKQLKTSFVILVTQNFLRLGVTIILQE